MPLTKGEGNPGKLTKDLRSDALIRLLYGVWQHLKRFGSGKGLISPSPSLHSSKSYIVRHRGSKSATHLRVPVVIRVKLPQVFCVTLGNNLYQPRYTEKNQEGLHYSDLSSFWCLTRRLATAPPLVFIARNGWLVDLSFASHFSKPFYIYEKLRFYTLLPTHVSVSIARSCSPQAAEVKRQSHVRQQENGGER